MHPLTNILHRRLRDAGLLKHVSPPVAEAVFVTHSRLCREGAARLGLEIRGG